MFKFKHKRSTFSNVRIKPFYTPVVGEEVECYWGQWVVVIVKEGSPNIGHWRLKLDVGM